MITIIHGGQTGVDRGAHISAVEHSLPIDGFAPASCEDEDGRIPQHVLRNLKICAEWGYPARTRKNIEISNALLLISDGKIRSPGSRMTLDLAIARNMVRGTLLSPLEAPQQAAWYVQQWQRQGMRDLRLMIAGPRASFWTLGEMTARRVVDAVARAR